MQPISFIYVGLGSMLGGMSRFGISIWLGNKGNGFPWATLVANLVGCLGIGLAAGIFERYQQMSALRLLCITGFLGGFTTFSTFSLESIQLLRSGHWLYASLYCALTLVIGLFLCWGTYSWARPTI